MYQRPDMLTPAPALNPQTQPNLDPRHIQDHFEDFYQDLFDELSKYGHLESLNICDNLADHMVNNSLSLSLSLALALFDYDFHYFDFWFFDLMLCLCLCEREQVGNVYVQFREEEHAANALRNLNGRFYSG